MLSQYWLISIDNSFVTVAYAGNIGLKSTWNYPQVDSFLIAVDTSLSSAAEKANLTPENEPSNAAFIIPHDWIGDDGKIVADYKKLIEQLCQKLELKPLGFITHDEAIVEDSSSDEGLPVSFLLIYLSPKYFDLSFVYLGKIKQHIHEPLANSFTPEYLENTLATINNDSALPPKVIIVGSYDISLINDLKNYAWIGKRNVETFLHFPDFETKTEIELMEIYHRVITRQFEPNKSINEVVPPQEVVAQIEIPATTDIVEVSPDELGFGFDNSPVTFKEESLVLPEPEIVAPTAKPQFKLPEIPKIKIKLPNFRLLFIIPAISPFLIIFLVFFYKVDVSLSFTPLEFNQSIDVDISTIATEKKFDIKLNLSTPATGTKTVGDKAKGQIVIFNKIDKVQNIPKGTVLENSNGLKFTTTSSIQVAASTINLDMGIITLGKTKASIEALEIGPEYNLSKDASFNFKDPSYSNLQAKAEENLNGGTKKEVLVVATADKQKLDGQITGEVTKNVDQKLKSEVNSLSGLVPETIIIKKNRAEYSREVGEESDTLSVVSDNTITAYLLETATKKSIVTDLINQKNEFSNTTFEVDKFVFSYTPSSADKLKGKLAISGPLSPSPDINSLRQDLMAKTPKYLEQLIPKKFPRVYNYQINSNLSLLTKLIMPIRWQNISIITK